MMKVLVGIATYNEIQNLPLLVQQLFDQLPGADVLVVDDSSPDGTGQWCRQRATEEPRLHCVVRPRKLGLGTAALVTMRYALDGDYDMLINMDADLSHDPRYAPQLIGAMDPPGGAPIDVAIASRYVHGGGIIGWPRHRRWMSRLINGFARCALGLACRDCSGSFRCYRVSRLRVLDLDAVYSRGYSFYEEILWHLKRAGASFAEVPIQFKDRQHGHSKITFREAIAAARILSWLGLRNWLGPARTRSVGQSDEGG